MPTPVVRPLFCGLVTGLLMISLLSSTPVHREPLSARHTYHGKYHTLIQVIHCPSEQLYDEATYGTYADAGYFGAVEYCQQSLPAAYWVYVSPRWYLWKHKDLSAIGFETLKQNIPLRSQTLTLTFDFKTEHRTWARAQSQAIAQGIQTLEQLTGIPYPGDNPYAIEEDPHLTDLLGLAGPQGMKLSSPPEGSFWTALHEVVHIWNADQEPVWIIEGLANYYSFLLMQKLRLPFRESETYAASIADWQAIQGTSEDLPLAGYYLDLPQGKAMAWWAMIHELFGPQFIKQVFVHLYHHKQLSLEQLSKMLRQAAGKDPAPLLDGWIRKGTYRVKKSRDFGPVRYPLPEAWPDT